MNKDLLRFTTTGSVDDGKSTLIGRLLYETQTIPEDQYNAVVTASEKRGKGFVDLSLLLDGLESEREQGITIDVAYRYFETKNRKFIVADTPGHEQYTRNMITGASNSDLAIILIDASQGILAQSKRHGFINSLLGISHLIVAVNKMDLVNYSQEVFENIKQLYKDFSAKLKISDITYVPISALHGDNCISRSEKTPWYQGSTVLEKLEEVQIANTRNLVDFRMPVQMVIRPDHTFRGFSGKISSGTIRPGMEVISLPSMQEAVVERIVTYDGDLNEASAPKSVTLTLDREIDISRGDMIVRKGNKPYISNNFIAMVCWMTENKFTDKELILKQTCSTVRATIKEVQTIIDINTLHKKRQTTPQVNDIFKAHLETKRPIFFDEYYKNKETGSFILIDPITHDTVACGMIIKSEAIQTNNEKLEYNRRLRRKIKKLCEILRDHKDIEVHGLMKEIEFLLDLL